jgi:Asp-tRNAAsn/Glu-tRNAGln amidotransferase C subunit
MEPFMTEQISPETFAHLVELAALDLDATQAEYLRGELNNQLKAISELAAIPLDEDVPLSSHGVPYTPEISPELRQDDWKPYPNPAEIIAQAPEVDEGYIIVPDIPHTTLE